eukprot:1339004-Pyramimonas_sp.AAC.1
MRYPTFIACAAQVCRGVRAVAHARACVQYVHVCPCVVVSGAAVLCRAALPCSRGLRERMLPLCMCVRVCAYVSVCACACAYVRVPVGAAVRIDVRCVKVKVKDRALKASGGQNADRGGHIGPPPRHVQHRQKAKPL